ncbi:MAG TPA: magnesium transporter CorA family protein [Spirochaetota bacterium]|nr:magnesium transporter CorA family protein [Spirochaetota bacterium]HOS31848.1 magnesium transporter CorA family protein [Spirochaetota bacterium]HOS56144.1 magnesium transporter CorA family protein [Spirochaetota bacterium]HPK61715.1 magnesium transporter CorA family protein [Spirochaetota bacterium]HQF76686.1 magnesium transporter CorA family protein [Spirochaetota bacterium]
MVNYFKIENNKLVESNLEDSIVIIYKKPEKNEMNYLISAYGMDEHNVNSSIDPDELGRIEFEEDHIMFLLKRPKDYSNEDNLLFKVTSVGVFIFKDKMIIIMPEDIQIFEGRQSFKLNSLLDVLLKLLFGTISHFLGHLKVINMISDSLEQKINTSMENKFLINMFTLEKSLVYFLNGINSNSVLFEKMKAAAARIGFTPDNLSLLDDIIIENTQCYKLAEIYANVLSGITAARAAIVSNNLNVLMKTLNIITISIMVPTFVVSVFSMNVGIPMQDKPFAFWVIMGLSAVSIILTSIFWKLKRW